MHGSTLTADGIDALLPQTQCTKCGYAGCRPYAEAIAAGEADIDRFPPGGEAGVRRLAAALGLPAKPLNPAHGVESPRAAAVVDEAVCIGCTLCIQACPTDAIVGGPKQMHTVLVSACTGCELCLPPCPVDCIALVPLAELARRGSRAAASEAGMSLVERAGIWRARYEAHQLRIVRQREQNDARLAAKAADKLRMLESHPANPDVDRKRAVVQAAIERARARRGGGTRSDGGSRA